MNESVSYCLCRKAHSIILLMITNIKTILFLVALTLSASLKAGEIKTNSVRMAAPPDWVTPGRVNSVVDHIQPMMEWNSQEVVAEGESRAQLQMVCSPGLI